jgi:glycosyltransferase involved in cell wall biosynthesis
VSAALVSFVVPCYNYGRYLRDCLDQILAQEGGYDIEIIAINDRSTDDTLAILQSYTDPRLHVIDHEVNRGHVFTVNEGLSASTGKYVVRVDPDDRHRLNFLRRTVPVLERYPEVGLVYADVALINAAGEITAPCSDVDHGGKDFKGNELIALLKKNFICAPTVVARREAWMEAWPVPDGLAFNDWYFNLMLARKWEFYYVSEVLADYRVHGSNHHTKISSDGSEEQSVIWLLDRVYAEREADATLEQAKREAKSEVYSSQYLDFGSKYFGHADNRKSRRCYTAANRYDPRHAVNPRVLRHLLASFIPRPLYNKAKQILGARSA